VIPAHDNAESPLRAYGQGSNLADNLQFALNSAGEVTIAGAPAMATCSTDADFLTSLIKSHIDSIRTTVLAAYSGAKFELL
jgi:hypothetical protein